MDNHHSAGSLNQGLKFLVEKLTGESVSNCYQCGKCTAGCPVNEEMDIAPNQALRMLQLDMESLDEKILNSQSIWLCLACETCVSRCPQEVDLPVIMDALRRESIKKDKVHPKAKDIVAFHKTFLESIRNNGRLFELGLIAGYKMKTLHLMQDVALAPKMLSRSKLSFFPHKIINKDAVAKIVDKAMKEEL